MEACVKRKALWLQLPNAKKREAKPRKKLRKVSPRQSKRIREYLKIRKKFLSQPDNILCRLCAKEGHGRLATEIHHRRGKVGALLFDVRWFLPTCWQHHRKIHDNVAWSLKEGWMLPRNGHIRSPAPITATLIQKPCSDTSKRSKAI